MLKTLTRPPDELKAVNTVQDHITVMSLSQWIAAGKKDVRAEDVPLTKAAYPSYPGMENVRVPGRLKGIDFLRWVSLILNDPSLTKQADGHKEIEAFSRFEWLGLKAGEIFDPDKLSPDIKAAVEAGIEDGRNAVIARISQVTGIDMNGWSLTTDLGYKDTDWLDRARYGYIAIVAPVPRGSHTGAYRINRLRRADIVTGWQVPLGTCGNRQPVQGNDLAPSQPIGETPAHLFNLRPLAALLDRILPRSDILISRFSSASAHILTC
jgi:hypothetical protein